MQVNWWTLVLQTVNFLVLVWLLQRFLYKPVRNVIERRRAEAERALNEGKVLQEKSKEELEHFQAEEAQLSHDRQDVLSEAHRNADAERQKILDDARRAADDLIAQTRAALAEEREKTREALQGDILDLATRLSAALLQELGSETVTDAALERIEAHLNGLGEAEREQIRRELAEAGAALTVVTATPLSAEKRAHWQKRFGDLLGAPAEAAFTVEPRLIGGAELHFPHIQVRYSWAEQLEKAKGDLAEDGVASG